MRSTFCRRAAYVLITLLLLACRSANAGPQLPENPTLDDYLRYAALNNPGLEGAFNRWKAALERVPQQRALPDPRFTYRYYIEHVETRVGPQEQSFGLSQTFPWFGKLALKGDIAFQQAESARESYEMAKRRLFYRVKYAFYEYYYLGRAIAVVGSTRDLMEGLEAAVRAKYRAGATQHGDVIRAQVELGKLEDRLRALEDLRGPVMARLNAALNRPTEADLPWPEPSAQEHVTASDAEVLSACAEANPELLALAHEISRRDRTIALARKNYWPDVTLGLNYIGTGPTRMTGVSDSGKDPIIAAVSINLPIWRDKLRAAEREARMRRRAAKDVKAERENALLAELKMALYGLRDAERKINLYRDTLTPKARQAMQVTDAAYRAGSADFNALVDAERVLLEFELSYERARSNYAQRLAEVEMLVGREIPRGSAPPPEEGDSAPAEPEEQP